MPKYHCDYCEIYLTNDSPSVRRSHMAGWRHLNNVRDYYADLGHGRAQSAIDAITSAHQRQVRQQEQQMARLHILQLQQQQAVAAVAANVAAGNLPQNATSSSSSTSASSAANSGAPLSSAAAAAAGRAMMSMMMMPPQQPPLQLHNGHGMPNNPNLYSNQNQGQQQHHHQNHYQNQHQNHHQNHHQNFHQQQQMMHGHGANSATPGTSNSQYAHGGRHGSYSFSSSHDGPGCPPYVPRQGGAGGFDLGSSNGGNPPRNNSYSSGSGGYQGRGDRNSTGGSDYTNGANPGLRYDQNISAASDTPDSRQQPRVRFGLPPPSDPSRPGLPSSRMPPPQPPRRADALHSSGSRNNESSP